MKNVIEDFDKDKVVIEEQSELKKQLKFLGSMKLKPGHTLFQVNKKTLEISRAEFQKNDAVYGKNGVKTSKKLVVNDDCIYIPALNERNVKKKVLKLLLFN